MSSVDWDTLYKIFIGAIGTLVTILLFRRDTASKLSNDAIALYERYKAEYADQDKRITALETDKAENARFREEATHKMAVMEQTIKDQYEEIELSHAHIAALCSQIIIDFHGVPVGREQIKKNWGRTQPKFRELMDDSDSMVA